VSVPITFWLLVGARKARVRDPGETADREIDVPDLPGLSAEKIAASLAVHAAARDTGGKTLYWHVQRRTTTIADAAMQTIERLPADIRIDRVDDMPESSAVVREIDGEKRKSLAEIAQRHSFGRTRNAASRV